LVFSVIFLSILLYFITHYLVCMITIYVMTYISPIFIPMALFTRTKAYFDGWLKVCISCALQPAVIAGFIALLITIGQYRLVIKSGVTDTRPDPLQFLTDLIKGVLFGNDGIIKKTYQQIIDTPGYRMSVSAILTLYIMFTGFSFLIGNINLTHVELIVRILKVSIVSILLSTDKAWTFFHDYLFVFFIDGVQQILQIINEASATGPGSQSLLGLLISPQTLSKLFSLLFVDWLGFIYIILYLIALYFIFFLIFKATIIYLTALITIGMIIIMGPIFICFMLFNITRSLFENWLRQLISYALQPMILFAGIAFISMIIRTEIYSTLGFAVCKHDFPNLGPINEIFGSFLEDI
ncbi:unnamed protein product, partial [Ixodes persulcatus]